MFRRKRSDVECDQVLVQGSRKAYEGIKFLVEADQSIAQSNRVDQFWKSRR